MLLWPCRELTDVECYTNDLLVMLKDEQPRAGSGIRTVSQVTVAKENVVASIKYS